MYRVLDPSNIVPLFSLTIYGIQRGPVSPPATLDNNLAEIKKESYSI
jgi:hypothetical protein